MKKQLAAGMVAALMLCGAGALADIQDGTFAGRWIAENKSRGRTFFNSKRDQLAKHPMEQVGEELRRNMIWGGDKNLDTASN